MTVYADLVFGVNASIDLMLLMLSPRLTHYPARPWRCLCGAAAGGTYAVLSLLPKCSFMRSCPWQFLCFLSMCMIAYGPRKKALRTAAVALLCSVGLAGAIQIFSKSFSENVILWKGAVFYPIGTDILILLAGGFYLAAALLAAGAFQHDRGEILSITLSCGERLINVRALYDTGNTLLDPMTGKGVVIINGEYSKTLLGFSIPESAYKDPAAQFPQLVRCSEIPLRLISYGAVGVEGGLLFAAACSLKVGKRRKQSVLAAFSPTEMGGSYEALIGGSVI